MTYDLLVTDARLVRPTGIVPCGIAIRGGRVAALLDPADRPPAAQVVDAAGRHVVPGLIDTHVHLGNAGRTFAEDFASESRAAVTGGVTTMLVHVFASNLVGEPESLDYRELVPIAERAARTRSLVDVKFHVGIVHPRYLADIPDLARDHGITSFKAFMTNKHPAQGRVERRTRGLTDGELLRFFRTVAEVPGGIAMVHAENSELIDCIDGPLRATGRQDLGAWEERSEPFGELEAIRHALVLAEHAGTPRVVIVHVGVGEGSEVLRRKTWGPVGLTVETCPHYLAFSSQDDLGVRGKCNPPLRARGQVAAAWDRVADGTFDIIGSDQLTFDLAAKGEDLWTAPPGITAGMPMILPVLLSEGIARGRLTWERLVELTAVAPARAFGLHPRKGSLELGADADLVIIDTDADVTVTAQGLNTASDYTPYEGFRAHGWAAVTIAGGQIVYQEGTVEPSRRGTVLR